MRTPNLSLLLEEKKPNIKKQKWYKYQSSFSYVLKFPQIENKMHTCHSDSSFSCFYLLCPSLSPPWLDGSRYCWASWSCLPTAWSSQTHSLCTPRASSAMIVPMPSPTQGLRLPAEHPQPSSTHDPENLREAISAYRIAANYLSQYSPPPPMATILPIRFLRNFVLSSLFTY